MGNTSIDTVVSLVNQRDTLRHYKVTLEHLLESIGKGEWVQDTKVRSVSFESQYSANVSIDAGRSNEPELQEFLYAVIRRTTEVAYEMIKTQHELVENDLEKINDWLAYK